MLDLVVLVADADQRESLRTLLGERAVDLGIRRPTFEILKHPQRDPGCYHGAPALLRIYLRSARHALVILDRDGSGRETQRAADIEQDLEQRLDANGWAGRAAAVVLDPELEAWVWSGAPQLPRVLGWPDQGPVLRAWLDDSKHWPRAHAKPEHPKETLLHTLRRTRKRHSAALYSGLAASVDFSGCLDSAFVKLMATLQKWFPAP